MSPLASYFLTGGPPPPPPPPPPPSPQVCILVGTTGETEMDKQIEITQKYLLSHGKR